MLSIRATEMDSIPRFSRETSSRSCLQYQEVELFERLILAIGTRKGLFVAESSKSRRKFQLRGPFFPGVGVYSALIDTRGKPRIYASSCNPFFGMKVLVSTDLGKTFKETKSAPEFPKDDGRAMANICRSFPEAGRRTSFVVSSRRLCFGAEI